VTDTIELPFHSTVYATHHGLVEGYFYKKDGGEFELVLRAANCPPSDGGKWPSFGAAFEAGRALAEGLRPLADVVADPLQKFRRAGATFVAIKDKEAGEWMVVTSRGNAIVDTGFRTADEGEARRVASGKQSKP